MVKNSSERVALFSNQTPLAANVKSFYSERDAHSTLRGDFNAAGEKTFPLKTIIFVLDIIYKMILYLYQLYPLYAIAHSALLVIYLVF